MFLGLILSIVVFGGIGYLTSRLALNLGFEKDKNWVALLAYTLVPLIALASLSLIIVALASAFGVSLAFAVEGLAKLFDASAGGIIAVLGSLFVLILGATVLAVGPATAFTASQVCLVVGAIMLYAVRDQELSKVWLPRAALLSYAFCMWPFAALFTFGL